MGVVVRGRVHGYSAIAVFICISIGAYWCTSKRSSRVICVFDDLLSACAQRDIDTYIQHAYAASTFDACDVQRAFACIDSVCSRVIAYSTCVIECRAYRPVASIQDNNVVIESGHIVPRSMFAASVIASCKRVTLAPYIMVQKQLLPADVRSLCRLPVDVCAGFEVVWHRPTEIYCVDKHDSRRLVVVTDAVDAAHLVKDYSQIMHAQMKQSQKYAWCVDMRFENQLVVRQMDRGSYEKKIVC